MIIDAHTHVFPPCFINRRSELLDDPCFKELYASPKAVMATAEELISSMDSAGIDMSVICAIGWSDHAKCVEHNNYLMEAVAKYPDRLIGLGMVNPAGAKAGEIVKEVERLRLGGLKGIGEFRPDLQEVNLADKHVMDPFVNSLRENNMLLMVHSSEPVGHQYAGKGKLTPDILYPFIKEYADIVVILAHWGGGLAFYELQPKVRNACRNVYYDTAATPFLYEADIYRLAIEIVGSHKILFGSDFPLLTQQRSMTHLGAEADEAARRQILGQNAAKLFDLAWKQ